MKLLVQTTGSFSLIDFTQRLEINKATPTVVRSTHFVQERLGMGALRVLGQLQDTATNDEMLTYLKESAGDKDLAIQSFLSAFGIDAVNEPEPVRSVKSKGRR